MNRFSKFFEIKVLKLVIQFVEWCPCRDFLWFLYMVKLRHNDAHGLRVSRLFNLWWSVLIEINPLTALISKTPSLWSAWVIVLTHVYVHQPNFTVNKNWRQKCKWIWITFKFTGFFIFHKFYTWKHGIHLRKLCNFGGFQYKFFRLGVQHNFFQDKCPISKHRVHGFLNWLLKVWTDIHSYLILIRLPQYF